MSKESLKSCVPECYIFADPAINDEEEIEGKNLDNHLLLLLIQHCDV